MTQHGLDKPGTRLWESFKSLKDNTWSTGVSSLTVTLSSHSLHIEMVWALQFTHGITEATKDKRRVRLSCRQTGDNWPALQGSDRLYDHTYSLAICPASLGDRQEAVTVGQTWSRTPESHQ